MITGIDTLTLPAKHHQAVIEWQKRHFVDYPYLYEHWSDFYRQAVLKSVVQLAPPFRARVVAEGVENAEDLVTIRALGIDLVQGWLFGRPVPQAEDSGKIWRQRRGRAA